MTMKSLILAAAMTVTASLASAGSLGPYTDLYVFGDSLSDPGNVALASGGTIPDTTYYANGQFTDLDTWATILGADSHLTGGTNYAYGGAKAVSDGDLSPDFFDQIGFFAPSAGSLSDNPLAAVFFGGNDLRGLVGTGLSDAEIFAAVGTIAATIGAGVDNLASLGLTDVIVFGLPNLGRLPAVLGTPLEDAARDLSLGFNATLQAVLAGSAANVTYFDSFGLFEEIAMNAGDYGISVTDIPCYIEGVFFCGTDAPSYLYFDGLHPTSTVHAAWASAVRATVVPLPGSLSLALGGLFGLWALQRRRKVAV
jgi:phospholipase/lecithinase/hemolysin